MILDKRRAHLLSTLHQSENPIPLQSLGNQMGVSQRTLYYDIEQINMWLEDKNLEPIKSQHAEGVYLPEETRQANVLHDENRFDDYQYQFSQQERKLLIEAKILLDEENSSMQNFMELTGMSRGTVAKVVKGIKQEFQNQNLSLVYKRGTGYLLHGSEEVKRKLLSNILSSILSYKEWDHVRTEVLHMIQTGPTLQDPNADQRNSVKSMLFEAEDQLGLTLTDEMVEFLSLHILVILKRIKDKKYIQIDEEEKRILQQTEAFRSSLVISHKLEQLWNLSIPIDEICFITMNFLGSKVQHDKFSRYSENELTGLRQVVQRMITDFQNYACVLFNDTNSLEDNLVTHIKPAYYRLKYDVHIANDLSESIKENYQDIFLLTKRVMKHLEDYVGKPIPDEEVAYLTLHFGGWLTKEKKSVDIRFKAIIICENGIGTSNMLQTQLENLIAGLDITRTVSMREFQANHYEADLIFSTNSLKSENIPVIHVPAILTNDEKQRVIQKMNEIFDMTHEPNHQINDVLTVIQNHAIIQNEEQLRRDLTLLLEKSTSPAKESSKPMLTELLTRKTIQFKETVSDWEEAIRVASQPLLDLDSIDSQYVEAMINNVKELGPYIVIAPRIALPHARPENGVKQLGMSLLRIKNPVLFSEKEKHKAQLIIVLAAIDNSTHLKALAQLTDILSNEEAINKLIEASQTEEVLDIVEHYHVEA